MDWSPTARAVWGKTDPEAQTWLPLVTHLEDVAAMATLIWDGFLPSSIRRTLSRLVGLSEQEVRTLYVFFAATHDLGKASPTFSHQGRLLVPALDAVMVKAGLRTTSVEHIRHEVVSQFAITEWLTSRFTIHRSKAQAWGAILAGHHGRYPSQPDLQRAETEPHVIGIGVWADVRTEILGRMAERAGLDTLPTGWADREVPVEAQALLTAAVVVADWLGSDSDRFPFGDDATSHERAARAFADLKLPPPWHPTEPQDDPDALLHARFPHLAEAPSRPIQGALVEASRTSTNAPLLIVEAPMGVGKTEAALLAAEVLAARFGQGGVFIGLPTMATANPMFARALDWLGKAIGPEDASVALAHGKAGLNDRYTGLRAKMRLSRIYDDDAAPHALSGRVVADAWLSGRRRAGLASFVVGTVDQALFGALKAKHVALRHLGLAGKVVVIDEVHAADTYMREYLKRVLMWLSAYGTPVILMSATLPPAQRDAYLAAYARGGGDRSKPTSCPADTYPRITRYDGQLTEVQVEPDAATSTVTLHRIPDAPETTGDLLATLLTDGGCAAVICNTVARAQQTYEVLAERFGAEVVLAHSRFLAPDRARREQRLVNQLGRDGDRPHRVIVVGTQVLEQSLDVDFDVMISDLAPIDLVLQRMGRLHRHERDRRPTRVAEPNLYLRGVEDWGDIPPKPVTGSVRVYGRAPLLRAAAVLDGRDQLRLPSDIPALVRRGYDLNLQCPHGWEEVWQASEQKHEAEQAGATGRAQTYLLTTPWHPESLTGLIDVDAGDAERAEERGSSQVRDSEDSIEVIALWRDADGALRLPDCAPRHPGAQIPQTVEWGTTGAEVSVARSMATCTINLPRQFTHQRVIEAVIGELEKSVDYSCWQKSNWVGGQLVLVFDEFDEASLAGETLHYSPSHGLVVTHPEDTHPKEPS